MSTFSGLNIGLSSLYAQRRGLELTGHNIANANTEGYSRQRLRPAGRRRPARRRLHSRSNGAGNGVMVAGVDRLRDVFLEARGAQERGTAAGLAGDRVLLGRVEAILSEPGDAGLQSQLADFWDGWDDVANQPDSLAARSQLLERARTLAAGINGAVDSSTRSATPRTSSSPRPSPTSTPSPSASPTTTRPSSRRPRPGCRPTT